MTAPSACRLRGDESRILANFKPAYGGVSTLAHELGHGYHNLNLAARTQLQRDTPMTLAETASIFCETIIRAGRRCAAATPHGAACHPGSRRCRARARWWWTSPAASCSSRRVFEARAGARTVGRRVERD